MIRIARIALVCAFALAALPARAGYQNLVVFGDSLSDGGNAYILSGGIFPPSPPYGQRFSNGPTASEYLAGNLGIQGFAPSVLGGTNYAVGGATTGVLNFNFEINSPAGLPNTLKFTGIQAQIGAYVLSGSVKNPDNTLYMVWGAPNDFFLGQATGQNPLLTAQTAIQNLALSVGALATTTGAKQVLVPTLPNLGATPSAIGSGTTAQQTLLALQFNAALAAAMTQVEQQTGTDVILFDTFAFLNEVIANPSAYGFTNTTQPCIGSLAALQSGCAGYLFFDDVHPTTLAHRILGGRFFQAVPEPSSVALAVLALFFAGRFLRNGRRTSQIAPRA